MRFLPLDFIDQKISEIAKACVITPQERERTDQALEQISAALRGCAGLSVAQIIKAGSAGKDTRITDDSDLDVVVLLNNFKQFR